jgi:uncharacterized protein involved in exopolysaccharide biosynthesis
MDLQSRYTDDYPDVIKAKRDVAALQAHIAQKNDSKNAVDPVKAQRSSVEPVQIAQLRAQIHQYDQVIAERTKEQDQIKQQIKLYQNRIQSSPAVEQQYKELTRGYQAALESYNDLQKKRDTSAMATDLERKQEGEQFRVLDPASLPSKPFFPDRQLFAMGGFGGGLALGLGLAFLLEMRNTPLRTERDVEFFLHLPVLAMVPSIEPGSNGKARKAVRLRADDSRLTVGVRS